MTSAIGFPVSERPAPRPGPVHLHGRLVDLAPLDAPAHAEGLWKALHGAENDALWLYLAEGPFHSREAFGEHLRAKAASADAVFFTVIDKASGQPAGYASYMRIEPAHRAVEVGNILYAPGLRRTAGATEAMYLMAAHIFEELRYRRYEWKCNALNAASRSAALRLGFQFEGIFRQHLIVKGRNRDTAWFSMLDGEWPGHKTALQRWLDPSNFDQSGKQVLTLRQCREAFVS